MVMDSIDTFPSLVDEPESMITDEYEDPWMFEEEIREPESMGALWGFYGEDFKGNEHRIFTGRPVFEKDGDNEKLHLLAKSGPYKSLPIWRDELDDSNVEAIPFHKEGRWNLIPTVHEDTEVVFIGPRMWEQVARLNPRTANTNRLPIGEQVWTPLTNGFFVSCMKKEDTRSFLKAGRELTKKKIETLAQGFIVRGKVLQELFALYEVFSEKNR